MSIREKVEELKGEIRKECGVEPNIEINIHESNNDYDFKTMNEIGNILQKELKGKKRINSDYGLLWINNQGDILEDSRDIIAEFAVFLEKRHARVK